MSFVVDDACSPGETRADAHDRVVERLWAPLDRDERILYERALVERKLRQQAGQIDDDDLDLSDADRAALDAGALLPE